MIYKNNKFNKISKNCNKLKNIKGNQIISNSSNKYDTNNKELIKFALSLMIENNSTLNNMIGNNNTQNNILTKKNFISRNSNK